MKRHFNSTGRPPQKVQKSSLAQATATDINPHNTTINDNIEQDFNIICDFMSRHKLMTERTLEKKKKSSLQDKQQQIEKWSKSDYFIRTKNPSSKKYLATIIMEQDDVEVFSIIIKHSLANTKDSQNSYSHRLNAAVDNKSIKIVQHLKQEYPDFYVNSFWHNLNIKTKIQKFVDQNIGRSNLSSHSATQAGLGNNQPTTSISRGTAPTTDSQNTIISPPIERLFPGDETANFLLEGNDFDEE